MTLTTAVWSFIFLGAVSLWWPRARALSVGVLGGGYLLALAAGFLDWRAAIVMAVLVAAAWMVKPEISARWRITGHVMFIALTLALALHLVPGFHNLRVIGPTRFTQDAAPFTMYLNLDKPLAGYWLMLAWPALALRRDGWRDLARGLAIAVVTAIVCLGLGVALGGIAYAPKWPHLAWLWALNNLLLVCMAEEAVFRGYLQDALSPPEPVMVTRSRSASPPFYSVWRTRPVEAPSFSWLGSRAWATAWHIGAEACRRPSSHTSASTSRISRCSPIRCWPAQLAEPRGHARRRLFSIAL